jgi:uncharacterized protein YkwD
MTHASRTKLILVAAFAGAMALTLGLMTSSGVTPAMAGGCSNATAAPSEATAKQFKAAILCLVNQERTSRGKDALDGNGKLTDVAESHTGVMLDKDCLEHTCPGEGSLTKRLKSVGYLKGPEWAYGENIGYETTPLEMVDAWMDSDYHRGNILKNKFVDVGAAAGKGTPNPNKPDAQFVTYTIIFGDGG